jgi:hypothetical protein
MPYTAFIGGVASGAVIVVPRDDYTCSSIGVFKGIKGAGGIAASRRAGGVAPEVWGPEPENRRIRLPRQDRAAMAAGRALPLPRRNRIQDAAVQMSEERCTTGRRSTVPADLAIIGCGGSSPTRSGWWRRAAPPGLGEGCDSRGSAPPGRSSTRGSRGRIWYREPGVREWRGGREGLDRNRPSAPVLPVRADRGAGVRITARTASPTYSQDSHVLPPARGGSPVTWK